MSIDSETRQRLLELVYGLLTDEEAAELRARIDADAELARAFVEAREASDLFRDAAQLESPPIALRRPEQPVAVPFVRTAPAEPPRPKPVVLSDVAVQASWARWANWVVGIAAGILLAISLGGYLYHRGQLHDIAAEHLRLQVAGPPRLQAGLPSQCSITTTSVTGDPMPTPIEFALYDPDGRTLMRRNEKTDDEGRLHITLPADVKPPHVRMEVRGIHQEKTETVEAQLAVAPEHYVTHLSLDKPLYRPGETVR